MNVHIQYHIWHVHQDLTLVRGNSGRMLLVAWQPCKEKRIVKCTFIIVASSVMI
jgi:hypothetical protein